MFGQVFGEVFRHALGQRGDQHPVTQGDALVDLRQHVVHLGRYRADLHLRVDQAGGPDHQFGDFVFSVLKLVIAGRGRHEDGARCPLLPFLEAQRPVVQRRRQPEAEFHQGFLARAVALEHRPDLRNRHVRLIHHQ